jgi:hypothetical protein
MNMKMFAFMGIALALTVSVNAPARAQENPSLSPGNDGQQKLWYANHLSAMTRP